MLAVILRALGVSPLMGFIVAAALIAAGLIALKAYDAGYSAADAMWREKALEAQIAKLELELKTQREADAAEDRLRAELEAEKDQLQKVIDAYLEELATRPDKCLLGDDAGRLQ